MTEITRESTLLEVAAAVSAALQRAGIEATLSGGAAVSIYSANEYQSKDLDFVTAAVIDELRPVLEELGFRHTGVPRLSQFSHPRTEWYVEFPPAPIAFGHLHVTHDDCAVIDTRAGQIRIITPTQSVMDRLAAVYAWNDQQSWEQAVLVASRQEIEWNVLEAWFNNEGAGEEEFQRFRQAVGS
jgi:hypothetical protein